MRKTFPSTIPVQYSYQGTVSISSHNASNYDDNQCISLFGEPVPPVSGEFLDNLDNYLYSSIHQHPKDSSNLLDEFPRYNSFAPQKGNPPSSPRRQLSSSNIKSQRPAVVIQNSSPREHSDVHHNNVIHLTPEIKILPNSSSSSENITPTMSRSQKNIPQEPVEVDSDTIFETRPTEQEWRNKERRSSQFSEDNSNFVRLIDPYSNVEWFRPSPDYQEWSRIPKLRPSSKNVMSINQQNVQRSSPVAVLLNDSNDSSSSGDKEPPPPITNLKQPQPQPIIRPKTGSHKTHSESILSITPEEYPVNLPPSGVIRRETSPVIITNSVATGSDYRIDTPRSHKRTSFTIITEKSPKTSRASSPLQLSTGRTSPFFGNGFKETATSNLKSRSFSSIPPLKKSQSTTHLKLPSIENTAGGSPRPSVQFDMSSSSKRHLSATSSSGTIFQGKQEKPVMPLRRNSTTLEKKVSSLETLPKISGHPEELLRPPSRRLNKSSTDIHADKEHQEQKKQPYFNPNPTSRQRGLLRIISSADSISKIPVRTDSITSLDDISIKRRTSLSPIRRVDSTSPEIRSSSQTEPRSSIVSDRRSSNLSSITTSDFSFRKNSISAAPDLVMNNRQQQLTSNRSQTKMKNVKSLATTARSPRKVAKPTSLSPIIGTPNKEAQSSPKKSNDLIEDDRGNIMSTSKIPVREISNLTSRSNSRINSKSNSRSNSPFKEYLVVSHPNSRVASKSPSRASSRSPSRTSFKPDIKTTSRSNSRLSFRDSSPIKDQITPKRQKKSVTKSRSPSPKKSRRKSISQSSSPINVRVRSREPSNTDMKGTKTRNLQSKKNIPSNISSRKDSVKNVNIKKDSTSAKKQSSSSNQKEDSHSKTTPYTNKTMTSKDNNSFNRNSSTGKKDLKKTTKEDFSPPKRESSMVKSVPSLKKGTSAQKLDISNKQNLMKKRTDSNLSKKLEKKNSFKEKVTTSDTSTNVETKTKEISEEEVPIKNKTETDSDGKLIPLTKANVVSMTTAAIAAQPVQITTAVTNQIPLRKMNSSGQITVANNNNEDNRDQMDLMNSKEAQEMFQETIDSTSEEIKKAIKNNMTDLKDVETSAKMVLDDAKSVMNDTKTPFEKSENLQTVLERPQTSSKVSMVNDALVVITENDMQKSPVPPSQPVEVEVSVINQKLTSDNMLQVGKRDVISMGNNMLSTPDSDNQVSLTGIKNQEDMSERVSERAISVLPEVECESANLQSYEDDHKSGDNDVGNNSSGVKKIKTNTMKQDVTGQGDVGKNGNMDSNAAEKGSDSQEYLNPESPTPTCCGKHSKCCKCFSKICIPCRRCQFSKCCRKKSEIERAPVLSNNQNDQEKCWKKLICCKRKKPTEMTISKKQIHTISEEPEVGSSSSTTQIGDSSPMKQNKCRLCLNKFFCCRSTNKVNSTTGETEEVKRCCFCIPCRSKKTEPMRAWQEERRESILSVPPPQRGRSNRIFEKLLCWKKKTAPIESRRTSMNSKKQSIAPTLPPEDTRPKLHIDLVEFNSKMKGAIPVMPLWLAWFCMICNCICPGLGTVFSGFFCVCVGIPRFSQYDSMKARIGSLIVNCVVGVAQLFCVLFCFVGWGWSVWWGTIMLKAARKLQKIKRVEQLELEEERRQAAAVAATVDRDVEAGKV